MVTNDIAPPENAGELLERVHAAWATFESAIADLSEAQMTQPGPEGWSVKDHLAHIATWERATTLILRRRPQAEAFGLDAATLKEMDIDALNEQIYQRDRGLSLQEVLEAGRRAHAELVEAVESLSDADIGRTIAEYGADPSDARPLLPKIVGDTYAHYAEHQVWIGELLAALR